MCDNHNNFWDCIEDSAVKQSIVRLTPDCICDKIVIWTCEICERKHVQEILYFEDSKEIAKTNRYGLENPKEVDFETILKDYNL